MDEINSPFLPWHADILQRALALKDQGRLPHAVMLDSPGESDFGEFALNLGMLLICDRPRALNPCGICQPCRLISAATYADFKLVTLEQDDKTRRQNKNIKIDQIRNLIHQLSLTHQYQRLKLALIFPAESMSPASANALLKTLEEPAPRTLLILLTHNRGQIPVTLRSRCQSWRIEPPMRSLGLDWLLHQHNLDKATASRYLDFANGDPELARYLQQFNFAALVDQFKTRFSRFLKGEIGITNLCQELLSFDASILRRLLDMILRAYCFQLSGIDAAAEAIGGGERRSARKLLQLQQRVHRQLAIEENNLDLQLQLEDVLISLKQILTRRLA